jgi:hypothetical protein
MPDLLAGSTIKGLDTPPTVDAFDNTSIANLTNTTYAEGTPEVGTTFIAPTTGRVSCTIGGGLRNNAATSDRVFLSPQIFLGTDDTGSEFLAPSVARYGCGSSGGSTTEDYQYLDRESLITGLTPGATYYARVMHVVTGGNTCDIAARSILIKPAT